MMRFQTFIETCFSILLISGSGLPDDEAFMAAAGNCTYPAVATESTNVFLVYLAAEAREAGVYFRHSADEGRTWNEARKISNENGDCMPPSITVNSGTVHCAWVDCGEVIDGELYYTRSMDGGGSWERNSVLVSNVNSATYPLIYSAGNDVYLIWQDVGTRVFFMASHDEGRTWENEMLLGKVGKHSCYCYPPALSVNGKELLVVWNDLSEKKKGFSLFGLFKADKNEMVSSVVCRKSADNGRTWGKEQIFASTEVSRETTDEVLNPTLFSSGARTFLFWQDKHDQPLGRILYAAFGPATQKGRISGTVFFPAPTRVSKCPLVVFDKDRKLHCTWTTFFRGESIVHYGTIDSAGNMLKDKMDLTAAAGRYQNPVIAMTPSGLLHIFWFDKPENKGQPSRIFLKTSADNGCTWENRGPQTKETQH